MSTATNTWIEDRIRERTEFNTAKLAQMEAIAAALPGKWIVIRPEHDTSQLNGEPMKIENLEAPRALWVVVLWNSKDRFQISATDWPEYTDIEDRTKPIRPGDLWNPRESTPRCTVARSRSAAAIAKDIERKILPEYDRLYERCRTVASEWEKRADVHKGKCQAIADACGYDGQLNIYARGSKHFRLDQIPGEKNGVRVEYDSPETVKIDMSADLAIKVIEFITQERAK